MAVAFLTGAEVINTTAAGTSFSGSFDSGATGSDRILVVFVTNEFLDDEITAITYNGVSLAQQAHVANTSSPNSKRSHCRIWTLVGPATGSNTLAFTKDAGSNDVLAYAAVYTGVDGSTPIGATNTDGAQEDSTPSLAITTSNANSMIVGAFAGWVGGVGDFTPDGNIGTERYDTSSASGNAGEYLVAFDTLTTTAGSYTQSGTWNGSRSATDYDSALVLVELNEAGAGGGITPEIVPPLAQRTVRHAGWH